MYGRARTRADALRRMGEKRSRTSKQRGQIDEQRGQSGGGARHAEGWGAMPEGDEGEECKPFGDTLCVIWLNTIIRGV